MREITMDLTGVYSADDFYEYLGENIDLPAYFGCNLDALWDVLTDIHRETTIHLLNIEEARSTMPRFVRGLERVAADLEAEELPVRIVFE